MYVLKELWRGNISPTERSVRPGSEYKRVSVESCERIEHFLATLTPEGRKQWEAICDLQSDMALMGEEDAFIYGFRMGARMMMEIVGDYSGPFVETEQ